MSFPYDQRTVSAMHQILGVAWNKADKTYVSEGPEILLDLQRVGVGVNGLSTEARRVAEKFRTDLWSVMDIRSADYGDADFSFQLQGTDILASQPNMILGDEPGLGKSKQALDAAAKNGFKSILIVCPNTLVWNWGTMPNAIEPGEIQKWHPEFTEGVVPSDRIKRKKFWSEPLPNVVITNYEKLILTDWPQDISFDVVIADEVHRAKNAQTQTYKALRRTFRHSKWGNWGLSGTPMEIRVEELYSVLGLFRPAVLGGFYKFREAHCITDWAGSVVGVKNIDLLRDRIGPFILRRTKTEVLKKLPPKTYNNVYIKLSNAEIAAYEAFTSNFNNWLDEHSVSGSGNPLVEMLRMRQFVCSPALFTDELGKGSKFQALQEILADRPGKTIVFCFFEEVISLLQGWLGTDPRAIISGKVPSNQRKAIVDEFNSGMIGDVLLCTDAGREGVNITGADMVIHYDQGQFNPKKLEQREDRAHRIGQKENVTVTNLLCLDTIDVGMYQLNRERDQLFKDIVDGAEEAILRKLDAPRLRRMVEGRLNHFGQH